LIKVFLTLAKVFLTLVNTLLIFEV
jgi:hypothetical protein